MTSFIPLLFLWLWGQRCERERPSTIVWPTAASPPPPMPAFQPQKNAPSADTGTPLSELHVAPPLVGPLRIEPYPDQPPSTKPKPAKKKSLLKKGLSFGLKQRPISVPEPPQKSVTVLELQQILNARGATIKP